MNPILLVAVVSVIDACDAALLGASFKGIERSFGFSPVALGMLSTAQFLSFSLSLPFHAMYLPRYGCRILLFWCCVGWSACAFVLPLVPNFYAQVAIRALNGAFLAGINPIAQVLVAENVREQRRGTAFGAIGSLHQVAKGFITYLTLRMGPDYWHVSYFGVGAASVLVLGRDAGGVWAKATGNFLSAYFINVICRFFPIWRVRKKSL